MRKIGMMSKVASPPSEVPRGVVDSTWGEDVEWNDDNQAERP